MKSISPIKNDLTEEIDREPLGKYVKVEGGFAFKSSRFVKEGIPIIRISNLDNGRLNIAECAKYPSETYEDYKKYEVKEGDILIAMSGATTGKVAVVKNLREKVLLNQRVGNFKVKNDEKVLKEFLYWIVTSPDYQKKLWNIAAGCAQPNISAKRLESIEVYFPPLEIQKKIVEILERAERLKEWRAEADSLTDEFLKCAFLEMFGDPLNNPKGWEIKKLNEFGDIKTGNTPSRKKPEYYGDYIDWIKSDNINTPLTYLTRSEEKLSEKGAEVGRIVPKGSILVTCIAGSVSCIGNVAIADRKVAFNQQINSITPKTYVNDLFLYHLILISQNYLQKFSTKALKGIINKRAFESLSFIFPPPDLQSKFGKLAAQVEEVKTQQKQSKCQIDDLFSNLMQKAFKGELVC